MLTALCVMWVKAADVDVLMLGKEARLLLLHLRTHTVDFDPPIGFALKNRINNKGIFMSFGLWLG